MICITPIPTVTNTLEQIYFGVALLDEFTPEYYNDKNDTFWQLFQHYSASAVEKLYHPYIVNKWKSNMYKSDYE